ncbi:class II aldolase/adducin family protein [Pseudonocardia sp. WMMC193]|uniref:class II aldolase/adducin family protein n=1 Tax=Pseudonocardia sp. WMMC193 TaxID=2911965 RepID=UPI0035AB9AA1
MRLVHLDGNEGVSGELDGYSPPNEMPLHTEVLRRRPDVDAVLHAHPPELVAADLAGIHIRPIVGAFDIPGTRLAAGGSRCTRAGAGAHPRARRGDGRLHGRTAGGRPPGTRADQRGGNRRAGGAAVGLGRWAGPALAEGSHRRRHPRRPSRRGHGRVPGAWRGLQHHHRPAARARPTARGRRSRTLLTPLPPPEERSISIRRRVSHRSRIGAVAALAPILGAGVRRRASARRTACSGCRRRGPGGG